MTYRGKSIVLELNNAGRLTKGLVAVSFHDRIAGGRVNGFLLRIAREKGIHEKNDNREGCLGVGVVH